MKSVRNGKERRDTGELTVNILRVLAAITLVGGSITIPSLPMTIGFVMKLINEGKESPIHKKKIRRVLHTLQEKDVLQFVSRNGELFVTIEDPFHPKLVKHSLKLLLDYKMKHHSWDRKWFMVFFDVPELQRNKRRRLRALLKDIGFFEYQKSVYIYPHECKKEVEYIRDIVESGTYLRYAVVTEIEDELKIKRHFLLV